MKKYFLGLIALVVGLGLSAFTLPKKAEVKANEDMFIWYVVEDNLIDPGSPVNPGDPWTVAEYQSETSSCTGSLDECARGFDSGSLPEEAEDQGTGHVYKNE